MQHQNQDEQLQALNKFLATNNKEEELVIKETITLNTLVHCIFDSKFTVFSQQKLRFFELFKFKVLKSVQQQIIQNQTQQNQQLSQKYNQKSCSKIGLSNILCCFKLLIQQNMIFLYNQSQWKSFIELLLKLILGQQYALESNQQEKYHLLKKFLENVIAARQQAETAPKTLMKSRSKGDLFNNENTLPPNKNLPQSINQPNLQEIVIFISGLKSSDMFRELFRTCPSPQNYHYLFQLCFVFLCHSYSRKVSDSDQKVIQTFINQFFLHSVIDDSNVQVYFKLLKNYISFFYKEFNMAMINLFIKVSSVMLVKKINESVTYPEAIIQVKKIKEKLGFIVGQINQQKRSKSNLSSQGDVDLKSFEYFFVSNALLDESFEESISKRIDFEFNDQILLKMFSTLSLAKNIKQSISYFTYLGSALKYISPTLDKTKLYPAKAFRFGHGQSFFSTNILSECQVNLKVKLQVSTQNIVLFELSSKNKRVQIYQKSFNNQSVGFGYLQVVKNQAKQKQSQYFVELQPCRQFLIAYEKSKVKVYSVKITNHQSLQTKLFQIEKFEPINSRLSINLQETDTKNESKIQELQKFIISTKTVKKDKTSTIDKVNLLDLVTNNLYQGQINAKSNELKPYAIKMSKLSLVEYPIDIKLFSSRYNIKEILLKCLSGIIVHYLENKKHQGLESEKELLQNIFSLFLKIFSQILSHSEIIDHVSKTFTGIFLEKYRPQTNQEEKNELHQSTLQLLDILQKSFRKLSQQKNYFVMTIFLSNVMSCSFDIYIMTLEFVLENLTKMCKKSFEESFDFVIKIIFQSFLLISDNRILKEEKNKLIQKVDILFKQVRQILSTKDLNRNEKISVQNSIEFVIQILTHDKYDNESNQKMRRFKFSYLLVYFIKNSLSCIDYDLEQRSSVFRSVMRLCSNKIKHLKQVIHSDQEQTKAKIMDDMEIRHQDSFIFSTTTVEDLIEDISQMSIGEFSLNRHVHQNLKDKVNIFSSYLDLYFGVGIYFIYTVSYEVKKPLQHLYVYLQKLLKYFDPETIIPPSLLYSELMTKCWLSFIKTQVFNYNNRFDRVMTQNLYQDIYANSLPILELLGRYDFDLLTPKILTRICNCLIYYPDLLLLPNINWKLQTRLNNMKDSSWLVQLMNELIQKSQSLNQNLKKNIQRSLITLLYRTFLNSSALSKLKILTLREIFSSKILLLSIELLVLSRQLIDGQVIQNFGQQRCKELLGMYLQNIKSYLVHLQQKVKRLRSQTKQQQLEQKETVITAEIVLKKFQLIQGFLKQERLKLYTEPNKVFNSDIFIHSQALEAIEDYVAKIVRYFQIEASQNERKQKEKQRFEQQKLIKATQIKLQQPKEDKNKNNLKQILQKQPSHKPQLFKKFLPTIETKKQIKLPKRPLQVVITKQQMLPFQTIKLTGTQIFINHIQNLTQIVNSLQKLLLEEQSSGTTSFKDQKIFFTDEILSEMEEENKHFDYVIDDYCDINGFKPLVKKKEVPINLPKMNSRAQLSVKEESSYKSIIEHLRSLKFSCQQKQIKAIPNSPKFKPMSPELDNYVDSFRVTYITSSQFYQGQLRVYNLHLCKFFENRQIDPSIYGQLMALESEQRKKNDIKKAPLSFQIKFDKNQDQFIKKSYLKVENSIEIYASNRSYLFVFRNQKQRDLFTKKIYEKNEINPENVDIYMKLWQKGIISNFQYLMFLNKYSQRSFSDISQYYVFPWTVCKFNASIIDNDFFKNPQNFRDLGKPIGKINCVKFNKIKSHFESSKRFFDPDRPNFLYGSFYSNPAIVSYYLIRLYPFSAHQHELQNYKFDHPDRLFGSIEKNFDAVYNITGDFKELIPEFYSSPYFLKNRNRYNFGLTQSKVLIDDIELPDWVKTKTPEQFIFRMRKCLQSEQVSLNLHKWIDLTFGIYAQRSKAQKHDNLYNEYVYGIERQTLQTSNLSFCNKYLKQFGQIPKIILNSEHPANLMKQKGRRMLKKSKSLTDMLREQLMKQDIKQYAYNECQRLNDDTQSALVKFIYKEGNEKDDRLKKQSKIDPQNNSQKQQQNQFNQSFLLIKQNCLIAKSSHGLGYYIFPEDNKDSTEYKCRSTSIEKCDFLTIDNARSLETYILTIQKGCLYGYKFGTKIMRAWKSSIGDRIQIETKQSIKMVKSIGSYLILINSLEEIKLYTTQQSSVDKKPFQQFTKEQKQKSKDEEKIQLEGFSLPHVKTIKADFEQVIEVYTNSYLSIFCIRNKANNFYIFDARQDLSVDFRARFEIYLMFEERIKHVLIHNMGYFLILTTKNRFLFVNLLGEIIVNLMVSFAVTKNFKTVPQSIQAVCFWSQQSSDIVFSSNMGMLYKVDLFDMAERRSSKEKNNLKFINIDQFQIFRQRAQTFVEKYELSQTKEKIVDIKIDRRGRHWKMYCLSESGNIFTLKNRFFDITKCMKIILRERQD